jgi:hypothetical protein
MGPPLAPAVNSYYVLHLGTEFKILYMDPASAALWLNDGWEMRPYESHAEALLAMEQWKVGATQPISLVKSSYPAKSQISSRG